MPKPASPRPNSPAPPSPAPVSPDPDVPANIHSPHKVSPAGLPVKKNEVFQSKSSSAKEKAGEKAIWLIYFLFFVVWFGGYWLGLTDYTTTVMGLPVWFAISCLWAFVGVVLALLYVSRRFFS